MFVERIIAEPDRAVLPRDEPAGLRAQIAELVSSLDGDERTLLTICGPAAAHLAVGGDAAAGLVVYATFDNVEFAELWRGDSQRMVRVVAGGQPGDYAEGAVVDLPTAVEAAAYFAQHGLLSPDLRWSTT